MTGPADSPADSPQGNRAEYKSHMLHAGMCKEALSLTYAVMSTN